MQIVSGGPILRSTRVSQAAGRRPIERRVDIWGGAEKQRLYLRGVQQGGNTQKSNNKELYKEQRRLVCWWNNALVMVYLAISLSRLSLWDTCWTLKASQCGEKIHQ